MARFSDVVKMASHSVVIVMLNVMLVTAKAGYQTVFGLSHILGFVCFTSYQIDDILCLASHLYHAMVYM